MAVSDLNNDGSEDLIISAPLYTDADRNIAAGWEVGKVSIYYNDKQGGFSENYGIAIGTQEGCRFGYSLAALGDINQDGFNDLAVGAPFCGDGQDGKVFIYHGSGVNIPIDLTPNQILTPSETQRPLKYFGFALSAGLDVDRNTYPDLAVGAHGSQRVILYRTRQIVMAVGELSFSHSSLDLGVTNFQTSSGQAVAGFSIDVCIQYEGQGLPGEIEFQYDIQLDVARELALRRSFFVETSQSSIQRTMRVQIDTPSCNVLHAFVAPTIRDKQTPISVSLDYRLVDNGQATASTVPPVLAEEVNTHIVSSIAFARECAGATCFPDLAVTASSDVTELTIGEAQVINLDVMVTNKGEDAFLSFLRIQEPNGVYFVTAGRFSTGAIASCTFHAPSRVRTCDLGNPVGANTSVAFELRYQTESYSTFAENVSFNLTAQSFDAEKPGSIHDNERTTNIPVYATANLTLQGAADLDRLIVRETDYPSDRNLSSEASIGPQIVHVMALNNAGPSAVGLTYLTILWPMRLKGGADIMTEPDVTMDTGHTCSRRTLENGQNMTREEGTTASTVDADNNNSTRTILHVSCDDDEVECYELTCPVASINTGSSAGRGSVVVTITSTVVADAVLNYTSVDAFRITSTVVALVHGSFYPGITFSPHPSVHPINVDTFVELEFAETIVLKKTTPPYVYIASIIGGVIILVAIVIGLYFAGFFKRRKLNSDQRRKLRQSIRQSRLMAKGKIYSPIQDGDPADTVETARDEDMVKSGKDGDPQNIGESVSKSDDDII
ncbi:integrin alpha-V-like [Diadema setosum]|uniref:integrin alpha-V-like n=1 Tax=Diadema setosum TaxID=31175 RepID=UPI003B3A3566